MTFRTLSVKARRVLVQRQRLAALESQLVSGMREFAGADISRATGLSQQFISDVLAERRPVGAALVERLGRKP